MESQILNKTECFFLLFIGHLGEPTERFYFDVQLIINYNRLSNQELIENLNPFCLGVQKKNVHRREELLMNMGGFSEQLQQRVT